MLPIAVGMVLASKLSIALTRRLGTKFAVAGGLAHVAGALAMIATFDAGTSDMEIALALGTLGQGMGLAMSPATDAIMGALPRAKAGIGSAMNDVVREVGGTLGIAVLGSLLTQQLRRGHGRRGRRPAGRGRRGRGRQRRRRPRGRRADRRRRRRQARRARQQRVRRRDGHDVDASPPPPPSSAR